MMSRHPTRPLRQMMHKSPNLNPWRRPVLWAVGLFVVFAFGELQAEIIILHLKTGDRIAGTIVSEDTNRVLITTAWIKDLAIPVAQIERREAAPAPVAAQKTNAPTPPAPAVAEEKPKPAGQPAL